MSAWYTAYRRLGLASFARGRRRAYNSYANPASTETAPSTAATASAGSQSFFRAPGRASVVFAAGTGIALSLLWATRPANTVYANEEEEGLHPPKYPWVWKGPFSSYDHASIRRGYQVYREVCAACHSLKFIAFRHLLNVAHHREELQAIAEEYEIEDGPDDKGDMFKRPRVVTDKHPSPYPNDQAARVANNGAVPPDLSVMTKARHGGADYLYALLTGYTDPPPGVEVREGLHYNPYFPGGAINMARAVYDGVVEYPDGTPATASQIAKDVTAFIQWASEPELEERHRTAMKVLPFLTSLTLLVLWYKRHKWSYLKARKIFNRPVSANPSASILTPPPQPFSQPPLKPPQPPTSSSL